MHDFSSIERGQKTLDAIAGRGNAETVQQAVQRLAALDPLDYEKSRDAEAKHLSVRVGVLDKQVSKARHAQADDDGRAMKFPTVALWPVPVNGAALLNELLATVQRFVVCERDTAVATVLWCAFTWLIDQVQVAPLAIITAPEKRCGKSQLLNLIGKVCCRPLVASNISPAAVFRVIEAYNPTLLIDEADSFFRENEELRGVINSGHTRQSAYVIRTVGEDHQPKQFSTWGAKAICGIGKLPDTIVDRAIVLELRRKLPTESVERLRYAEPGLFDRLASKLARFASDVGSDIAVARPQLPDALNDRAQDNWEPLLAIADIAGEHWPKMARSAALKLAGMEQDTASLSAELLTDIRSVFDDKQSDRISTADLLQALTDDDIKPWATYNRGKPMSARQLVKQLKSYGISPKTIRVGYDTAKGYLRPEFDDVFHRYLALTPDSPKNSVTSSQTPEKSTNTDTCSVTNQQKPADHKSAFVTPKALNNNYCYEVTQKTGGEGVKIVEIEI